MNGPAQRHEPASNRHTCCDCALGQSDTPAGKHSHAGCFTRHTVEAVRCHQGQQWNLALKLAVLYAARQVSCCTDRRPWLCCDDAWRLHNRCSRRIGCCVACPASLGHGFIRASARQTSFAWPVKYPSRPASAGAVNQSTHACSSARSHGPGVESLELCGFRGLTRHAGQAIMKRWWCLRANVPPADGAMRCTCCGQANAHVA